jgi:hypothetical protein
VGRGRGVVLGGAGEGAAQLVPAVSPSSQTHTVGNKTASCLFFLKSRIIGNFDSYLAIIAQRAFPVTTGPKLRVPVMSGKPHRKMPERAAILKGFRMPREVSGILMIRAR